MDHIESRGFDDLYQTTTGPADDGAFDLRVQAKAKVQTMVVLSAETTGGGDFLQLGLLLASGVFPEEADLSAEGIPVRMGSFQSKLDPVAAWGVGVRIRRPQDRVVFNHSKLCCSKLCCSGDSPTSATPMPSSGQPGRSSFMRRPSGPLSSQTVRPESMPIFSGERPTALPAHRNRAKCGAWTFPVSVIAYWPRIVRL